MTRIHTAPISVFTGLWNSAFSHGVGYESQPAGSFFETDRVGGYFIDFRAKTVSPSAADPENLLPTGLAQLALGWWERILAGDRGAREEFYRLCAMLEKTAEADDDEMRWRYEVRSRKYHLELPWYSAMAQAQIASVFVRAFTLSDNHHHADLATCAIAPLLAADSDLVAQTEDGPVLEEAPSEPASHILNGWIYAIWGLWDVDVALNQPKVRELLDASMKCLLMKLPSYDVGWWTRYSLFPHRLPDLAKPFYHRLHIDQLEVLYRLTENSVFRETARRWDEYDTPLHRAVATSQKALFVATRYA
jgi:heparosan-N-sulfate-glucuronate 5-epimerase